MHCLVSTDDIIKVASSNMKHGTVFLAVIDGGVLWLTEGMVPSEVLRMFCGIYILSICVHNPQTSRSVVTCV